MTERTLVPIFVFWAFLTIITPTLILLSENSKADPDLNGNITEGMKVRRMIRTPPAPTKSVVAEEELASAPAPVPVPLPLPTPTGSSHTHHNLTHISNRTDDGITLSFPEILLQVKKTNVR
ncbi:uncharacterized protein LOC133295904 [Gastrolobium bilobum]|uniref:uncharacterized protein LOC133295904 n=1 Tax=Gastrolobium bilobum TaxID=150636 RepID=UPI002AB0F685|nr:uncharacterized protein LOC133295904 [Gastrolobium bilobum]